MVEFKLIPPFIPIYDLKILLIVNFLSKDILTAVSSGKNVKYMIPWSYPGCSWHVSILSTPISCVKKIEPSQFRLQVKILKKIIFTISFQVLTKWSLLVSLTQQSKSDFLSPKTIDLCSYPGGIDCVPKYWATILSRNLQDQKKEVVF